VTLQFTDEVHEGRMGKGYSREDTASLFTLHQPDEHMCHSSTLHLRVSLVAQCAEEFTGSLDVVFGKGTFFDIDQINTRVTFQQ
jgi:hypothetical protein